MGRRRPSIQGKAMLQTPRRDSGQNVELGIEPDYDFLSDEYRRFYRADRATAFQSPLWLAGIHRILVPARGARQQTVTLRDRTDGRLVALLPMVTQKAAGLRISQPADFGVCDYNSVVADRDELAALASRPAIVQGLRKALSGSDLVFFRKVREDDFDVGRLLGKHATSRGENDAFACETGLDFDHWRLKILRRKFTKELGRQQSKAEREYGGYTHRRLLDASEIEQAFGFMREAQGERGYVSPLADEAQYRFYLETAKAGAESGEVITYASNLRGEPVAALFGPAGDGEFHAVLLGFAAGEYERISPGIQLIYRAGQDQIAHGRSRIDLCLGDPGYKTHFRPVATQMHNHTVALTPPGTAVSLIYHRSKRLKNLLRGFLPHVR